MPDDPASKKLLDKIQELEQRLATLPKPRPVGLATAWAVETTVWEQAMQRMQAEQEAQKEWIRKMEESASAIARGFGPLLGWDIGDTASQQRREISQEVASLKAELARLDRKPEPSPIVQPQPADPANDLVIYGDKGMLRRDKTFMEFRYESKDGTTTHHYSLAGRQKSREPERAGILWNATKQKKPVKNNRKEFRGTNPKKAFRSPGGKRFANDFVRTDGLGNWQLVVP